MKRKKGIVAVMVLPLAGGLSGCVTPNFDIPTTADGVPTLTTIVSRITCELVGMVKDNPDGADFPNKTSLLTGNYVVAINLSLEVTDTGELTPNFGFPRLANAATFNLGAKYSKARTQNLTTNLYYSMRKLRSRWVANNNYGTCPVADTNLAGDLGIAKSVMTNFTAANRMTSSNTGNGGEFGGTVNFTVVRNLNAVGPTWTLESFIGPGGFGKIERKNVDKITYAFASGGEEPNDDAPPSQQTVEDAKDLLNTLFLQQITQ